MTYYRCKTLECLKQNYNDSIELEAYKLRGVSNKVKRLIAKQMNKCL